MADAVSPDSTPSDDPLDDIVAAVADGAPVNWAEAEARASTTANRDSFGTCRCSPSWRKYNASTHSESTHTPTSGDQIPPLPPSFKDGRFVIEHFLGRGGFGVVHKAYNKERNAHVALKAFTRRGIDGVYDFKNEFACSRASPTRTSSRFTSCSATSGRGSLPWNWFRAWTSSAMSGLVTTSPRPPIRTRPRLPRAHAT